VQTLTGELFDLIIDMKGFALEDDAQPEAPWACTRCGNRRGFRRRGQRPGGRTSLTKADKVRLAAWWSSAGGVAGGSSQCWSCSAYPPTNGAVSG